jgi:hypothetical protein
MINELFLHRVYGADKQKSLQNVLISISKNKDANSQYFTKIIGENIEGFVKTLLDNQIFLIPCYYQDAYIFDIQSLKGLL